MIHHTLVYCIVKPGFARFYQIFTFPESSNNTLKFGFFPGFLKNRIPNPIFLAKNPLLYHDGAKGKFVKLFRRR